MTPIYETSAKLLVMARSQPGAGVDSAYQGALLSQQLVKSFATVLTSRSIALEALRQNPEPLTAQTLQSQTSAEAIPDTLLISLRIRDTDPDRAQRLTNSVATAFVHHAPGLQNGSTVEVNLVEPALRPTIPIKPRTKLNLLFGILLGLAVGVGFALLAESLDTSIKTVQDLEKIIEGPVLGAIPIFSDDRELLPVAATPRSVEAEAFRKLRTNFAFLGVDRGGLCCVVTSPSPDEGKSTVTANLAMAIADSGQRVIIVEADLRKPTLYKTFHLQNQVGTTTVLLDRVDTQDALQLVDGGMVAVLASGQLPPNPSELLGSAKMAEVIRELRTCADVVLIDSPPLLPVTDPMVLAPLADGILLVTRAGATSRDQALAARIACDRVGAHILGTVLNATQVRSSSRGAYYAEYQSYISEQSLKRVDRNGQRGRANGQPRSARHHDSRVPS
jgi:capsular exopolysaccharide synthesis family protein